MAAASHADALCRLSACEAAALIRSRDLSPVALVDAVLARADRLDPVLRLFAHRMDDEARSAAHAAGAAVMAGGPLGPLHGVPITIKDNIPVAGVPMRHGSSAIPATIPAADAEIVRRVRAAGAIVIGKTTLPEFAHRVLTDSPDCGITRNPWNLDRTPGGSSGGAAACLAAGVAPLGIGTDGGGSVRCPASCTGTVALKATLGRIPHETAPDGFGNYYFQGPMARTVADTALLTAVVQGPHTADPYALSPPPDVAAVALDGLRVGWLERVGPYPPDREVARITRDALATLQALGTDVLPVQSACFDGAFEIYRVLATAAHATRYGHLLASDDLTVSMRDSVEQGLRWSAVDLLAAQDRRTALFRAVQLLFETVDVIATPTLNAAPPALDAGGSIATAWYGEWAAPLYPFNMTGHPALSVPAGVTADGLPVGLQLIGPWHADGLLMDVAAAIESSLRLVERFAFPELG